MGLVGDEFEFGLRLGLVGEFKGREEEELNSASFCFARNFLFSGDNAWMLARLSPVKPSLSYEPR